MSSARRRVEITDSARLITAVSIGNMFEYIDLTLYSFFSVIIGQVMFPRQDPGAQILLSLGVFGAGYCARPVGAIFFGSLADRKGRKVAVNRSMLLMACGTAMIGLTPSYNAIGIAAPLFVLLGRLLQGFSAGGQAGATTTFLVESAPPNLKGFYGSWTVATQGAATTIGSGAAWIMSVLVTPEQLSLWGWRVPFIAGILILPVAGYLRRVLKETLEIASAEIAAKSAPMTKLMQTHVKTAFVALLGAIGGNAAYVTINLYMPTYAIHELHMPTNVSVAAAICAGMVTFVASPLGGWLSDIYGRKTPQVVSRIVLILLAYPAFWLISNHPSVFTLLSCVAGLSFLLAMSAGIYAQMTECFPKGLRASGFSTSYALATALCGGFAQLAMTGLIQLTGSKLVPAFFLMIMGSVSLIGVLAMKPLTGDSDALPGMSDRIEPGDDEVLISALQAGV